MAKAYDPKRIAALVAGYRKNRPLDRDFYVEPDVYAADLERIFRRQWLYIGHSCMIPKAGDWLSYQIAGESIVAVRGASGEIRAFHNVCRHRGGTVCRGESGHAKRLMCHYHQWVYELDGRLMTDTAADFGVDRSALGLKPVPLIDAAGLLFFNLADDPPSFEAPRAEIVRRLTVHGMDRAKVAKTVVYDVKANWKIVFENNRECYHCPGNHPEYNAATYDVLRTDSRRKDDVERITKAANERFRRLGLDEGDAWSFMTGKFWRAHRTPLMEGFSTQSLDGKPVGPLIGDLKERDAGTLRITIFPNFWQHASDDHAVATRITPLALDLCRIHVHWLVREDAVEGKDYTLDRLLPVWKQTSEQDWEICESVQVGVNSSRYEPGPFSKTLEGNVAQFIEWYLDEIAPAGASGPRLVKRA